MNLWYSTETVTSWLLRYVSNEWLRKDMRTEKSLLKWKVGPLLIWSSNPLTAKYLHGGHFTLGGPPLSLLLPRLKLFMTHKTLQWLHPCQHFSILLNALRSYKSLFSHPRGFSSVIAKYKMGLGGSSSLQPPSHPSHNILRFFFPATFFPFHSICLDVQ